MTTFLKRKKSFLLGSQPFALRLAPCTLCRCYEVPNSVNPFLAPSVLGACFCVNIDADAFEPALPIVAQAVLPTPQFYRLAVQHRCDSHRRKSGFPVNVVCFCDSGIIGQVLPCILPSPDLASISTAPAPDRTDHTER